MAVDLDAPDHFVSDLHHVARIEEVVSPKQRIADLVGAPVQGAIDAQGLDLGIARRRPAGLLHHMLNQLIHICMACQAAQNADFRPRTKKRIRDIPGYAGICRDIVGCAPRRLHPMIVGVPPRVGAAYTGIGQRNCGSRLLIHQMAFKPRFPGVLGSLK